MNAKESKAIAALKHLEDIWPDTLWLFCNGQGVYIMRTENGKRKMLKSGGVDPNYEVGRVSIPSDGGDW